MKGLVDIQAKTVTSLMMNNFARSCLKSMEILEKDHGLSDWHLPFYLLAATCLELFAKITIFKKMDRDGKSFKEIEKELKKYNHNLYKLYNVSSVGANFLSGSNILKIELIENNTGIFRYEFHVKDNKTPIHVYDTESMRYGLMSTNENVAFVAYQTSALLALCKNVFSAMISN